MMMHHSMMHLNSSRKINAIIYIVTHERKDDNIEIRREERKNGKERLTYVHLGLDCTYKKHNT